MQKNVFVWYVVCLSCCVELCYAVLGFFFCVGVMYSGEYDVYPYYLIVAVSILSMLITGNKQEITKVEVLISHSEVDEWTGDEC
jgi:hypothetical protein